MRVRLGANVLLDCLVLEKDGQPRAGKVASAGILDWCDRGIHTGLVAWHTLPIVAYYHGRQNPEKETAEMMDALLLFLEVPHAGHAHATAWRSTGLRDFEDAL